MKTFTSVPGLFSKAYNFINPPVGKHVWNLSRSGLYFRADGRKPAEIIRDQFKAPMTKAGIEGLTRGDLMSYQKYNSPCIGLGACTDIIGLKKGFMDFNPSHVKDKHIYGLLTTAVSMLEIKLDLGLSSGRYDYENESIILSDVPAEHILLAVSPKDHARLFAGMEVENKMGSSEKGIPESLALDDVSSSRNVFTWLLKHNSPKMAAKVASFTLADVRNEGAIVNSIKMMGLTEKDAKTLFESMLELRMEEEQVSSPSGRP